MNNSQEMIALTWYKSGEDSPWVLSLESLDNKKYEVSVGKNGFVSIGPRLNSSIEEMESKIYRYPFKYDMRQVRNYPARLFDSKLMKDKITYLESSVEFEKEIRKGIKQTPFYPLEETVEIVEKSKYFESATQENKITIKEEAVNINKEGTDNNWFWLFANSQNIKVINSSTIEIYIDAYIWPEGIEVPKTVGEQNILDSQRTVRIDLLGLKSFGSKEEIKIEDVRKYSVYKTDEELKNKIYNIDVFSNAEEEAKDYLKELIETKGILALSLQYSKDLGMPVSVSGNLLAVAYSTGLNDLDKVKDIVTGGNLEGVNINKSLLKETYSKNNDVKKEYVDSADIPLVEYFNQSESHSSHGISPVSWVEEVGIQTMSLKTHNVSTHSQTEDEVIEKIVEDIVKDTRNFGSSNHYIEGYINNDLAFVPANDDRLLSGELYNTYNESEFDGIPKNDRAGILPYDYTHKVRIGDVMLEIPPLSIRATKQQANEHVPTLRSRNAMHKGVGSSRQTLTLDLYFHDLENINGHKRLAYTKNNGKQVFYYMDGLRTLLAQFIKSPFVPIDNEYINDSLGVRNVAMQNIHAQTVEGFPEALMVSLTLEDFDVSPYLMDEGDLGMVMNYPLYRWYYQQSLQEPGSGFSTKTYLPEISSLDNTFSFQVANETFLSNRTDVINEFNALETPSELKRNLEEEAKKSSKNSTNKRKAMVHINEAMNSYYRFQEYYNSLPSKIRKKYKPSQLPIVTNANRRNLKSGSITQIPNDEFQVAIEAGREIYGSRVSLNNGVTNLLEESAKGSQGRTKRRLAEDDSVLIGTYQLDRVPIINQLIINAGLPGIIQVQINDSAFRKKMDDLLTRAKLKGKEQGLREAYDPYRRTFFNSNVYFVPAGTAGGVDFLGALKSFSREIKNEQDKINQKVEDYTLRYNSMVNEINIAEEDIPMDDFYIDDLIPIDMSVSLTNNLSTVQVQAAQTPSFQYLGAQQPEVQITFSTTDKGVQQIDDMFRKVARYAKEYRTGLVSNFMAISNPMINMFGIQAVLPNTFDITTVEGQPDQKIVTMILTGFDRTQRRQEALYSFAGGRVTTEMKELHLDNYDPQVNSLFVHEKMKYMELYPDLELPTYNELSEALKYLDTGVGKFENRTGQVYVDPDFYISTETTVRKQLAEILGDSRGTPVKVTDNVEGSGSTNILHNQGLSVNNKVQKMVNEDNENYVDPHLDWKGYEGSSKAEDGEDEEFEVSPGLDIRPTTGNLSSVSQSMSNAATKSINGRGKNPSKEEVWKYLYQQTVYMFSQFDEFVPNDDIKGYTSIDDIDNHDSLVALGKSPLHDYYSGMMSIKDKTLWLKNGVSDKISHKYVKENFEKTPGRLIQVKDNLSGRTLFIREMSYLRLFTYFKTIIETESNWNQFDAQGEPFVTKQNNGRAIKVGIMGAPLSKASNVIEAGKLGTDWKYNIRFSLSNIRRTYTQATRNNRYGDIHMRGLDWAIVSHGGAQLPPIFHSRNSRDDVPYTSSKQAIMPEAIDYFANFSNYFIRSTQNLKNGNIVPIFSAGDKVMRDQMSEILGIDASEADEFIQEAFELESNNFDKYTLQDKLKLMYVDMHQHDQVGRFVRAFPSFSLMLIDEGKWFQNFRTWDNFYGYNALHSIDVYKSRKVAADTAVISMSNMYGNLSSSHGSQSHPDLRMPSFFSSQFFEQYLLGRPTEQQLEQRAEQYDQIMLQTGARVHLRMGYGADASYLPIVFNGAIAEISTDEVIEITAQGDALELQNVISGDPDDDNVGFMNRVQEPRRTIGELMTSKGNWIKEVVNVATDSTFFKDTPMGIAHFGSTIESEKGNRAIIPGENKEEFGESLQNVYSQNGMETKSQWHYKDGSTMSRMETMGEFAKGLLTNIAVLFGDTLPHDEDNVAISYYGRTVWEVIQTFALVSQDYVAEVVPFEFRSTLFFGKPHWVMQYRYDSDFVYDSDREKIDRVVTKAHVKTFMQAHVYNSYYNIINNNIMASEEGLYNNVIVTYDGRQAGPVQADSDIRFDKQRTIDVEANILAPRMIEYFRAEDQALVYGQSTLRDFMKDMYKGEYSIIGDPTVKPYDVIYLNDHVNQINGIHMVKAVHHSMDGEHGLVSYIEPDAYIYNFDEELGELSTGIFSIGKNLNISLASIGMKSGLAFMTTAVISKLVGKAISYGTAKGVAAVNSNIGVGIIKYSASKLFESAGNLYNAGGTTVTLAKGMRSATSLKELNHLVSTANASLKSDIAKYAAKGAAEQATFFQKQANAMQAFLQGPKTAGNLKKAGTAVKKSGQMLKGVVKTKVALYVVAYAVFSIATATISEWWSRKKQNAEAIKVVPLMHRGKRWTALMNWHKGSVMGDDPSLRDRLFNSEFFDGDDEVNEVFGNSLFKAMNFFFD